MNFNFLKCLFFGHRALKLNWGEPYIPNFITINYGSKSHLINIELCQNCNLTFWKRNEINNAPDRDNSKE